MSTLETILSLWITVQGCAVIFLCFERDRMSTQIDDLTDYIYKLRERNNRGD